MKSLPVAKFRLGGKEFAVLPWSEYSRLTRRTSAKKQKPSPEDSGDAAEIARRAKEPIKSYFALRRKLGLS